MTTQTPNDPIPTREQDAAKFAAWIDELDEDVIQGEFGYEPGEFTVYTSHWRELYDEGLTPRQAWQQTLDGHRNARLEEDAAKASNYARIVAEDEAVRARHKLEGPSQ